MAGKARRDKTRQDNEAFQIVLQSQLHIAVILSILSYQTKGWRKHSVIAVSDQNQIVMQM